MTDRKVNGEQLALMFREGAAVLGANVKKVDALNVFPVPDGDTGTNMNLTITSGVREVDQKERHHAGNVAKTFSKGLLMGARGNSGVILSQLFRGFSKSVEKKETLTVDDLQKALQEGVDTAYKAVMKPVEGTILTVAKDAADTETGHNSGSPAGWMEEVYKNAESSLQKTPELLQVLKEVGVVDSGGQGLVYIYQGMMQSLYGITSQQDKANNPSMDELVKVEHHQNAQSHLSSEEIEYGYCTELMVKLNKENGAGQSFDENAFKQEIARWGDSLLVVSDDDLVKVHIHAEYPGEVLSKAQRHGSLLHVKIDNMREQYEALHKDRQEENPGAKEADTPAGAPFAPFGFVTIAAGEGVQALFRGLGAQEVVAGGQTMNPSTEDILNAVTKVEAETIFILPNNGNIVMSAEQAAEVSGKHVRVIPSKTIPQGLSAMFAFSEDASPDDNDKKMKQALSEVTSGQITYAVRETKMGGLHINKGDYMGIVEKDIATAGPELETVTINLLHELLNKESDIVTLIRGEGGTEAVEEAVSSFVEETYPDVELEIHDGGQPLYSYIIAVE
ncbi:DAK2 domain-containing protein [Salibacterium qingdaonense]|uniref:DhaL domain-containing protein n=1 Tax=Salibacterium qingdaonense TaxID=266892 RepID=A0A1I4PG20_9BACI|nr:DAK2 domain-containing protein [Salibacterium qingdaonense]SFM26466.1 hypothetical protein SAMN04488054_1263 [Salibacterium qingdaonense]